MKVSFLVSISLGSDLYTFLYQIRLCPSYLNSVIDECYKTLCDTFPDFVVSLDHACGPLTLHSSIKDLVHYTREGLKILSKEKEEQPH